MIKERSFYFTRHGQSVHNEQGICAGGKYDSPLTRKGIAEAYALKGSLTTFSIDHVISSPMIRAKMTAEIATGRSPIVDENLREIDIGIFEGKRAVEAGLIEYIKNLSGDRLIPGGESKNAYIAKVAASVNRWLHAYEGTILFVAHGFTYVALLSSLGRSIQEKDLELGNAVLVHFHHNGHYWEVKSQVLSKIESLS